MIVAYTIFGLSAGGRGSVGINYLMEFVPVKKQYLVMTLLMCLDSSQLVYQSIFYDIYPHSRPLQMQGIILTAFCMVLLFLIPESPKFLFAKRQYDGCR